MLASEGTKSLKFFTLFQKAPALSFSLVNTFDSKQSFQYFIPCALQPSLTSRFVSSFYCFISIRYLLWLCFGILFSVLIHSFPIDAFQFHRLAASGSCSSARAHIKRFFPLTKHEIRIVLHDERNETSVFQPSGLKPFHVKGPSASTLYASSFYISVKSFW